MNSKIIIEGFHILKTSKRYKQVTITSKLRYLGFEVSESSFSNILREKKAGEDVLFKTAMGIQKIIELELGFYWKDGKFLKNNSSDWEPIIVPNLSVQEPSLILKPGFAFHEEGRLSIEKKVSFFSTAQKEIVEFGVTLNTFSSYFYTRKDKEFKAPVEKLLEKGVNFKCYLLNPECNEARLYFEDRKRAVKGEKNNIEKIKDSIQRLMRLQEEFAQAGYKGTFEIFTYKHIPHNYFMVVDGLTPNAKMMISHYIYGEQRAKCPVIEFSKNTNHFLYKKYWSSFNFFIQDAKKIKLEDSTSSF